MEKIKSVFRKVFRIEDRLNPTAHQVNDREMMDALYLSNKEAIDKSEAEDNRVKAIAAEKLRLEEEAELAAKVKLMQEEQEKDRLSKVDSKRREAELKFKNQRVKNKLKNDKKRMKMHRKGQGW